VRGWGAVEVLSQRQARYWRWRLRSPVCAVADAIAAAAGAVVFATVALDCAVTWPADRVLLSHHDISRLAGALLPACWLWLFLVPMVFARGQHFFPRTERRPWRKPALPDLLEATVKPLLRPQVRACLAAAAVASLAVIVVSFALGASKGSAQVLPGPVYLVSTLDLNNAASTRVSAAQFSLWQARFVRGDSFFTLFGLLTMWAAASMLALRGQPGRVR
jgi:hypothetical protein